MGTSSKSKKKTPDAEAPPAEASAPAPKAKKAKAVKVAKAVDESHYPGKVSFPKHLYGPKGTEKIVANEEELAAAKKKGFSEDPSDEHLHD